MTNICHCTADSFAIFINSAALLNKVWSRVSSLQAGVPHHEGAAQVGEGGGSERDMRGASEHAHFR